MNEPSSVSLHILYYKIQQMSLLSDKLTVSTKLWECAAHSMKQSHVYMYVAWF